MSLSCTHGRERFYQSHLGLCDVTERTVRWMLLKEIVSAVCNGNSRTLNQLVIINCEIRFVVEVTFLVLVKFRCFGIKQMTSNSISPQQKVVTRKQDFVLYPISKGQWQTPLSTFCTRVYWSSIRRELLVTKTIYVASSVVMIHTYCRAYTIYGFRYQVPDRWGSLAGKPMEFDLQRSTNALIKLDTLHPV